MGLDFNETSRQKQHKSGKVSTKITFLLFEIKQIQKQENH